MQIIDLEDNIHVGNEQSLNILCFLKPDSVSMLYVVQFTISLAYSDDFHCFFVM